MSPPKKQVKAQSASDKKRAGAGPPPMLIPQQLPEHTPSPPPRPPARPSTPTYTVLAQSPVPQFSSVREETQTAGPQGPGEPQYIAGSIYFPRSRIRLTHANGPEISEYDYNARYIILGDSETEIAALSKAISDQLRDLIHQCRSDDEVKELLASAEKPDALVNFNGYVIGVEAYLRLSHEDKQSLPQTRLRRLFEVLASNTGAGYAVYHHPSRGGIAAVEQVNTALEDPENIRILYAVVEMAQKIDAVLDSITNSPSIPLWWDPTEKDRISQYCIASFGEELYRYTHTHFGAEPFLDRIREHLPDIFSQDNLQLLFTSGISPARINGFFRNQVLWYSGIIGELGLRVDEIGNPAAMQANVPQPGRHRVPPPKPEASKCCLLI